LFSLLFYFLTKIKHLISPHGVVHSDLCVEFSYFWALFPFSSSYGLGDLCRIQSWR
jgi:hypothetical protein